MSRNGILDTPICSLLGIRYPIVLAGMGGICCPELVAAVSNAGGLGVLGGATLTPDTLAEWIRETRRLTDRPFGVDTLLPVAVPGGGTRKSLRVEVPREHLAFAEEFRERHRIPRHTGGPSQGWPVFTRDLFQRQIEVVLEERVAVYVAGLGDPSFLVPEAHARGIKVIGVAGKVKHARRMRDGGVDAIVAQGTDAGGHNSPIGALALVPQVVDAVSPLPVLAAGGIADGRGLAAALCLGAAGVWCGTVFLATPEARLPGFQKQAILESAEDDTMVTRSITGKPMRVIRNAWAVEFEASGLKPLPMPYQNLVAGPVLHAATRAGMREVNPGIAGQTIGMIRQLRPAAEVVASIVAEAERVLAERSGSG